MRAILLAALIAAGACHAFAQSRAPSIVVPIRFQLGSTCWKFAGRGTDFIGDFRASQTVVVTVSGDFHMSDGRRNWTEHQPWQIYISGPNQFFADGEGTMTTRLPISGRYTFSVGPNAIRGNRGEIEICTQ